MGSSGRALTFEDHKPPLHRDAEFLVLGRPGGGAHPRYLWLRVGGGLGNRAGQVDAAGWRNLAQCSPNGGSPAGWMEGQGDNPIAGSTIDTIRVANHATTQNIFRFGCGYNSEA